MKFTNSAITAAAFFVGATLASAFSPQKTAFVSTRVASKGVISATGYKGLCPCPGCVYSTECDCLSCGMKTLLRMSTAEEVPSEVVAMDGVASEEEAHNAERPARDSGIKKHKTSDGKGMALSDLVVGSFVDGTVKTVTSYGAFVDIGAATDALLHVSRLSADFVSNVEDIVKAGDSVNVRIASIDAEKGQVAISMLSEEDEAASKAARGGGKRKERPQRSGGDRSAQVATINALDETGFDDAKMVEGEVVSVLDFGAFVRFDASQLAESVTGELDGLVHISALTAGRAESVAAFVTVGDKVQVRVRQLDTEGSKVSLSMITKEDEEANRSQRGGKPRRRRNQMFSDDEMGAKDWKESLEKFQAVNHVITNDFILEDKRK
jgi:predicted RNA-binding protein with RPS1 domain